MNWPAQKADWLSIWSPSVTPGPGRQRSQVREGRARRGPTSGWWNPPSIIMPEPLARSEIHQEVGRVVDCLVGENLLRNVRLADTDALEMVYCSATFRRKKSDHWARQAAAPASR
jgi:hypothetical protein